jgi:hypothetical protein
VFVGCFRCWVWLWCISLISLVGGIPTPWSRSRVCTPTNHPGAICMYLFVYPKAFLSFRGFILREDRQECCESTSVNPFVSSDKARGADRQKTPAAAHQTRTCAHVDLSAPSPRCHSTYIPIAAAAARRSSSILARFFWRHLDIASRTKPK